MILTFVILFIMSLAASAFAFSYEKHNWRWGLAIMGVGLLVLLMMFLLSGDSKIDTEETLVDYTLVSVVIDGETYTGKWYPDRQEHFTAFNKDWSFCVEGTIYRVGYGTAG